MDQLLEQHERISFFECEPVVSDPGVAWAYNHLEFHTTRGCDDFLVILEPGYETLRIAWRRDGREIINLNLEKVCRLKLEMSVDREVMVGKFRASTGVTQFRFQLKPKPHPQWSVGGSDLHALNATCAGALVRERQGAGLKAARDMHKLALARGD